MSARILVVEDNAALRRGLATALRETWPEVDEESNGRRAVDRISDPDELPYDVVVTDLRLPGADGVSVLRAALGRDPSTSVLLTTAYGSVETAVESMRLGAFDFLEKPFELAELERCVERAVDLRARNTPHSSATETAVLDEPGDAIVAESAAMRDAIELAKRVAPTRSTVLISGETGTGKEVIAELLHSLSLRADGPFVKVNCAAVPETLLESELFGHERGAFTGADRQRVGRFEQASGGTLFLDEIGDISLVTQSKLLRVLQDQEFYRLGGTRPLRTDTRILTATNRDLGQAIRERRFREDLYFRLDVIRIHLAPLRERREDAVVLAEALVRRFGEALERPALRLAAGALERIRAYSWPGNVRQLSNVIERAVVMCKGPCVEACDLAIDDGPCVPEGGAGDGWQIELPPEGISMRAVEKELVLAALRRTGFVQKDAAQLLDVSRRKLNYMIQRMRITHPSWRRNRNSA